MPIYGHWGFTLATEADKHAANVARSLGYLMLTTERQNGHSSDGSIPSAAMA